MKKLIPFLALTLATFGAFAQYPLPNTQVYGSLQVDSSFYNEFQGYTLANDSLNVGAGNAPFVGSYKLIAPQQYIINGFGDFTAVGDKPLVARFGLWGSLANTSLTIKDSTLAALRSDSAVNLVAEQRMNLNSLGDVWIVADTSIYLIADTTLTISADYELNITAKEGTFSTSSGSDTYINSSADISLRSDSVGFFQSQQEIYLSANSDDENWEYGFTAFSKDASCCQRTATMYALREDYLLDVQQIYVDTLQIKISSRYGLASGSDYNYNDLIIDSTGFAFTYGQSAGSPSWTPSGNGFIIMNETTALFRSDIASLTIESRHRDVNVLAVREVTVTADASDVTLTSNSGNITLSASNGTIEANTATNFNAPTKHTPINATTASAITPQDGMMIYVNSTNGTFTQVGFWGYVNGTWTALH